MGRAILMKDHGLERDCCTPNGDIITLKLEDDFTQITFWDSSGKQMGNDEDFCFRQDEFSDRYLLSRMYVPNKGQGLGRAALQFFKETTEAVIWARPFNGMTEEDGSHLTEDAPGFVMKMQEEGLIEETSFDGDYFNEYQ